MKAAVQGSGALPRHLAAMFAYVGRAERGVKCVDATFGGGAELHLDRLAAAARMQ